MHFNELIDRRDADGIGSHDLPCDERAGPRGASTGRLVRAIRVVEWSGQDQSKPVSSSVHFRSTAWNR